MGTITYVGKGKLIAFTNTNHYEPDVVAQYWFGGDDTMVREKEGTFKAIPFAVVLHHGTARYASGLHADSEAIPLMESLDQREVLLYLDSNDHLWFCACKSLPQDPAQSAGFTRRSDLSAEPTVDSQALQAKTPSILFTDVKESTAITSALGQDAARTLVRDLEQILTTAITSHQGVVIKEMGDGTMAAFPIASAAIDAAIVMQREVTKRFRNGPIQLRIRIGINAGEPILEAKDLHGASVILSQRAMSQADGGQILVTETVRNLVRGKHYEFIEHSNSTLKGFADSVTLFEVLWTQERLLILGLAGKAGSDFDSQVLRVLERYGSFTTIQADDFVDAAWQLPEVRLAVAERFGRETIFENGLQADPTKWRRRRGVLGEIVASDPAAAEDLNAILNPFVTANTFVQIRRLVQAGTRRIAIASTRLANKEQKLFCHRTWYIDRDEGQRRKALEQEYSARGLPDDYVAAKIRQIMRLQGDVIEPCDFPYDEVITHPENDELLKKTITGRVRELLLTEQKGVDGIKEFSAGARHGQFVRSMLSLAQIRGQSIRLRGQGLFNPKAGKVETSIRACVEACVQWSEGTMQVAEQDSIVEFWPGRSIPSEVLTFDLPNGLSVSLLVVTLIPLCLSHDRRFEFVLRGCTDLEHSSPCDYYKNVLFPLLNRLGVGVNIDIEERGFWGGKRGSVRLSIQGAQRLKRLDLTQKGEPRRITFSHNSTGLDESFYKRFVDRMEAFCTAVNFTGALRFQGEQHKGTKKSVSMSVALETEYSILGADAACDKECDRSSHDDTMSELLVRVKKILDSPAALDHFTSDKILLYLALAGGAAAIPVSDDMEHIYAQLGLISWFHSGRIEIRIAGTVLHVQMDPMFGVPD